MATLPSQSALNDLTGGYYSYWTDGTTEGRATLAVVLGSTDAQAADASFSTLALGTDLAVTHGGTGASTASGARDNLGLTIGTNVQAYDDDLAEIAALDPTANQMIYVDGGTNWATTSLTSFARTLLDDANASTARTTLGVDPAGTDNSTDVTIAAGLDYLTITGQEITLNQIDLTTDVTGALPLANAAFADQNVLQASSPSFAGVTIASDLTLASGSITSVSGAISFGNENLTTTGTLAAGATTVTGSLTATERLITASTVSGGVVFGGASSGHIYRDAATGDLQIVVQSTKNLDITGNTSITGTLETSSTAIIGSTSVSPDGTLHVYTASAGAVTAAAGADDLVVENSAEAGVSILTPDANVGYVIFGSPSDATGAWISWQQSAATFRLGSQTSGASTILTSGSGTTALTLDSSQNATFAGDVTVPYGGKLLITGFSTYSANYLEGGTNSLSLKREGGTTIQSWDFSSNIVTLSGNLTLSAGELQLSAATTARASLNIPSGTAPTSPTNGDIWSDGSDILVRLGGTTYTLNKT